MISETSTPPFHFSFYIALFSPLSYEQKDDWIGDNRDEDLEIVAVAIAPYIYTLVYVLIQKATNQNAVVLKARAHIYKKDILTRFYPKLNKIKVAFEIKCYSLLKPRAATKIVMGESWFNRTSVEGNERLFLYSYTKGVGIQTL